MSIVSCKKSKNIRRVKIENIKRLNLKNSNFERKPSDKFIEITVDSAEIKKMLGGRISGKKILTKNEINYPVGLYRHINIANDQRGGTTSDKIGKLHMFFRNRKFRSVGEWKRWYLKRYPKVIKNTVNIILDDFKKVFDVSPNKYRKWVKLFVNNLIINQTYTGFKIQEVILIKMAKIYNTNYRWSTGEEDSSGIDGFVGEIPISIKPKTSKQNKKPGVKRIYYKIDEKDKILSFTFSL